MLAVIAALLLSLLSPQPGGSPFSVSESQLSAFSSSEGITFYRARYYDPGLGRFSSEDTTGFDGKDFSLIRYALNSPNMFFVVDGLSMTLEQRQLQIQINAKAGRAFQFAVQKIYQLGRNSSSILNGTRIPDILAQGIIGEIKAVRYLSLTRQLRDYLAFAQASNANFVLVIAEGTKLSGPLIQALIRYGATVIVI